METTLFDQKEAELKAQLQQLADERQAEAERHQDELKNLISILSAEALAYRNQAERTDNTDEKKKLYRFAEESENEANTIRLQLGLQPELLEQENKNEKTKNRKINSFLYKSVVSLLVFFFSDFISAKLDTGFFSYALKYVSQIAYALFVVFGGVWVSTGILFVFISEYSTTDLQEDFNSSSGSVRLSILAVLAASLLYFLATVFPHAN